MYSREQILSMEPGRELDALVAARVFGWHVENNRCLIEGKLTSSEKTWMTNKRWSTDISAAFEVVEQMKLKGYDVALESFGNLLHARFFSRMEGGYGEHDSGKSFSHGICIAALRTLNEEESA